MKAVVLHAYGAPDQLQYEEFTDPTAGSGEVLVRVVAAPSTRIRLPEVGFGLVPGAGGTVSLPRRIGRHRTAFLGLTGATIDTETAHRWGLVDTVDD